jgi:glutamate-1-semialdehyde 2,1-aminomutase
MHFRPEDRLRSNSLKLDHGNEHFGIAKNFLLSGTGAPPRIYPLIGRPLYLKRADGAYLYDLDGNSFIDFHSSAGAALLGHNHPAIKAAMMRALDQGFYCNYESESHARVAQQICEMVPSGELVRFCGSGSEATAAALRVSRAVTGRKRYLKFEGHFNGMHDHVFFNMDATLGRQLPNGEVEPVHESAGVPDDLDALVTVLPFNDHETFRRAMMRHRGEFAAILMEPVMYNAGCILPDKSFVQLVRDEATRDGTVLIFDEVLSGFRMAPGGGQEYIGVTPDVTCLSKAVGGGVPLSAIAGKQFVMDGLTPVGKTVVTGTYTGHLMTVMGALAALEELRKPDFYPRLNRLANRFYTGFNEILRRRKIKAVVQGLGARFGIFFGMEDTPITHFRKVVSCFDSEMDKKFVRLAFERGLYFRDPGHRIVPIHHGITAAHDDEVIDETLNRLDDVFAAFA